MDNDRKSIKGATFNVLQLFLERFWRYFVTFTDGIAQYCLATEIECRCKLASVLLVLLWPLRFDEKSFEGLRVRFRCGTGMHLS